MLIEEWCRDYNIAMNVGNLIYFSLVSGGTQGQ